MASIQGLYDNPLPKGPEGPPRWCHPHRVLVTLMGSEMLSHFFFLIFFSF